MWRIKGVFLQTGKSKIESYYINSVEILGFFYIFYFFFFNQISFASENSSRYCQKVLAPYKRLKRGNKQKQS